MSRRTGRVIQFVALFMVLSTPPAASQTSAVSPGTRMRISLQTDTNENDRVIGLVESYDSQSILLRTVGPDGLPGAQLRIALEDVNRSEVSLGVSGNAGEGLLLGALAGLTPGLVMYGTGYPAGLGLLVGIPLGAAMGAVIGDSHKSEKWKGVPRAWDGVRVSPNLQGGGLRLGVSYRFR